MRTLTRLAASLAGALTLWGGTAFAQTPVTATTSPPLPAPPEIDALLASLRDWSFSTAIWAGYGYKDNLLLSYANPERSAFARGGVEMLWLKLTESFEFSAYADASGSRYFSAKTADHDTRVKVRVEPGYNFGDAWKLSLPVAGYFFDQVFDASDTETERVITKLKVKGVVVNPTLRWDFHPSWWIEAQAGGHQKWYEDGAYDGKIGEGQVQLGWQRGKRFRARVTGAQRWRDFDERAQYSSAGRELLDTQLKISERELEGRIDVTWDKARCWQTTTRASELHYRDNGSGYFNYRERKVGQELDWRCGAWRVQLEATAARLDFSVQTIGIGIDPPARIKDEFLVDLRIERKLSERWALLGHYTWERNRSNDSFASYRVNEGLLGLRWSWEK